jgi:hypothetical protein
MATWDKEVPHSPRDCKLFGHAWFNVPVEFQPWQDGTPMQFHCERSNCIKWEIWSELDGEVIARRYVYPQGYVYAEDEYRPNKREMRMAYIEAQISRTRQERRPRKRSTP